MDGRRTSTRSTPGTTTRCRCPTSTRTGASSRRRRAYTASRCRRSHGGGGTPGGGVLPRAARGRAPAVRERVSAMGGGDWLRPPPCAARRDVPQTYGQLTTGGKTGIVRALDWTAGTIVIDVLWQ